MVLLRYESNYRRVDWDIRQLWSQCGYCPVTPQSLSSITAWSLLMPKGSNSKTDPESTVVCPLHSSFTRPASLPLNAEACWPKDVGIAALELYFPTQYVDQAELKKIWWWLGAVAQAYNSSYLGVCDCEDGVLRPAQAKFPKIPPQLIPRTQYPHLSPQLCREAQIVGLRSRPTQA
jgi:hypothetical protein